jgi:antigen flippase
VSSSYSQILRSSAITGGAAGINMLISMVSVKFGAVLLGPAAFGQLSLYQSFLSFAGSVANLGIQDSAVRSIARAGGAEDLVEVSRVATAARRIAWTLGIGTWLLTAALAWPLSELIFGNGDQALSIAVLGATIPLSLVAGSRLAVHRGFRRIGDLAQISVITAASSTAVSVALFVWLRAAGIVPSLVCSAAIGFAVPLAFRRRLPALPQTEMRVAETARVGRALLGVGVAMLTASLASALVGIVIPAMVTRELGAVAMGMYAAAWGVSGVFANFILNAMGADYFPRLSGASHDRELMSRMVNEQTVVGVLLALPGLVATVVFAPLAIGIFFSAEFHPAAGLLPWYALGIFGRVTSWPLGIVLLARQDSKTFMAMEIVFTLLWIGLTQVGLTHFGLVGVAGAFCGMYAVYQIVILVVVAARAGFSWEAATVRLVLLSLALFGAVAATQWLPQPWGMIAGCAGVIVAGVASLRGLAARLGRDHRLVQWVARLPGVGRLLP